MLGLFEDQQEAKVAGGASGGDEVGVSGKGRVAWASYAW